VRRCSVPCVRSAAMKLQIHVVAIVAAAEKHAERQCGETGRHRDHHVGTDGGNSQTPMPRGRLVLCDAITYSRPLQTGGRWWMLRR